MSAQPKPKLMTVAEYLAHERQAEYKSDFIDGRLYPVHNPFGRGDPQAMAGASREHNRVKENLVIQIGGRFLNGPCRTYSSDQRVRLSPTRRYTYPDLLVVCGAEEFAADDPDALVNPGVIVEVLSHTTEGYDRGLKFAAYQRVPSIGEVLFVAQDQPRVERFVRQPDGSWVLTVFDDPAGELVLGTVPARVPLADIYRGIDFTAHVPPPAIDPGAE